MTPPRLLYLSVYDPSVPLSGTGARGGELVNHLAERFELDLIYLEGSGQPPVPELVARFAGRLRGVRWQRSVRFTQPDYFLFSRRLFGLARQRIREVRPDVIYCDYGICGVYGVLLKREFGIPFVYGSHNIEYLVHRDKASVDPRRWLLIPWVYAAERAAVRDADLVVPISVTDAIRYTRWTTRAKFCVIPQGFDEQLFNPFYPPVRNPAPVVLFCGNLRYPANRDAIQFLRDRVVDRVRAAYPEVRFLMVGAEPPLHLHHPNFAFTGYVPDYPELLRQADAVVAPLLQGRGSPTKVIEALAAGKPVVATPVGARSIDTDFHTLFVAEPEEFADRLVEVLRREEPVSASDYDRVRAHFAWPVLMDRLALAIQAVAQRRAGHVSTASAGVGDRPGSGSSLGQPVSRSNNSR